MTSFAPADGLRVMVETPAAWHRPASLHPENTNAAQALRKTLQPVTPAPAEIIEKCRELPGRPGEAGTHFGVKLDGTPGAVIASVAARTHRGVSRCAGSGFAVRSALMRAAKRAAGGIENAARKARPVSSKWLAVSRCGKGKPSAHLIEMPDD